MGRGRQRAKQAKVARELKYQSARTDFVALQRELALGPAGHVRGEDGGDPTDDWGDERDDVPG